MPLTKVETHNFDNYVVTTEKLSNTAVAAFAQTLTPKISNITETDNTYTALDDTAMNTSGGFIVITGADFQSGASVIIDTSTANSTTFVNTSTLRAELPAKAAGTYNLYVVNPDGGTAIRVNAITYSAFPAFSTGATLSNQYANTAFAVSISATSDSNISYSNTSTLPAGTSLLANGYFFGTVTIGTETTYSFTVKATDVENQDTSRTFSLTVTVIAKRLWRVGYNNHGQLGTNDTTNLNSLTQLGSLSDWDQISTGGSAALAVKTNGTLWSWGLNTGGQLGVSGALVYPARSSPAQVGANTNWSRVSVGGVSALAVKTDGTLWAWGTNTNGQLGTNNVTSTNSPVQIGAGTNWNKIAVGTTHSLATKTDGTLWAWGGNASGALGLGLATADNRSSPVQIGVATNWNLIKVSTSYAACVIATKTDGTLWSWGNGLVGQLGHNDRVYRSVPAQVGSLTNWNDIDIRNRAAIASRTDGRLFAWGRNANGELGVNDRVYRSSPTQVGASTDWNLVGMSVYHAGAIKTNGTLWLWGRSGYGQIASGGVDRSSPVQIGSATNWVQINLGGPYASWAIALN